MEKAPKPQDPNKKPKPMFDDCNHCSKKYQITAINAKLHLFEKQPDCNFIYCTCSHCQGTTKMFIDDYTVEQGIGNGLPVSLEDYADDTTYKQWLQVKGIELVQPRDITDRHERAIAALGQTLRSIPSDMFWEEMNSPHDYKPYPQRWA